MATNKETAMLKLILTESSETTNNALQSIDEIARLGAQALIAKALKEEVNALSLGHE